MERPLGKNQLKFFWWIMVAVLLILGGKIFYLNVVRGGYYREVAQGNRIRSIAIKAPRRIPAGEAVSRYEAPRGEDVHYVRGNGSPPRPTDVAVEP